MFAGTKTHVPLFSQPAMFKQPVSAGHHLTTFHQLHVQWGVKTVGDRVVVNNENTKLKHHQAIIFQSPTIGNQQPSTTIQLVRCTKG